MLSCTFKSFSLTPLCLLLLLSSGSTHANGQELTLLTRALKHPWSLAFIDEQTVLISEKSGALQQFNLRTQALTPRLHNLTIANHGQGGLLDLLIHNNTLWVSFAEQHKNGKSTTALAKARLNDTNQLHFKVIFRANPPRTSGYHFGSRLLHANGFIYASIGERGGGNIAQDPSNHHGSIIRLNLDGSIPKDNPHFNQHPTWLPELYQIGLRNPQGLTHDPKTNRLYLSNHGAKGGDFIGLIEAGGNYGWDIIGWGGTHYSGKPIGSGKAWLPGFSQPLHTWIPSIAVSAILFYQGKAFPQWQQSLLVASLKDQSLRQLSWDANNRIQERLIFKNHIGRIRDIKADSYGNLYLLSNGPDALWKLTP